MKTKKYILPNEITASDLKQIRKKLKLTQKEFANLINCSKSTIERWEVSTEPISGPVVLAVKMLDAYPEYVDKIKVPHKTMPLRLWYMYKEKVCTIIDVNELTKEIRITNYTDNAMFKAFGIIENPDYGMYLEFLKSRCFPETRDKLKLVLRDMNLPFYDPFMIIEKTEGRMAEDDFWIKIER